MSVQLHDTFFKGEMLQAHVGISGGKSVGRIEKRRHCNATICVQEAEKYIILQEKLCWTSHLQPRFLNLKYLLPHVRKERAPIRKDRG